MRRCLLIQQPSPTLEATDTQQSPLLRPVGDPSGPQAVARETRRSRFPIVLGLSGLLRS